MLALKKDLSQPPLPVPPGAAMKAAEGFEVDLRDALAHTTVRELSLEEFLRVQDDLSHRKAS